MMTKHDDYAILITDDDRGSREALREIVQSEGYRTILAASGEEALNIVQEEPIHLAMFDLHMPRLTGLETIELVHQFNPPLPCILVTADANEGVIRQAFQVRAYSVIPKPVSKNVVLTIVMRTLIRVYGSDEPVDPNESASEN